MRRDRKETAEMQRNAEKKEEWQENGWQKDEEGNQNENIFANHLFALSGLRFLLCKLCVSAIRGFRFSSTVMG